MKSGTDILNRWTNEWTIWDGEDIVQGITDGVLCWLCSSIRGPCGKVHSRPNKRSSIRGDYVPIILSGAIKTIIV